MGSAREAAKRAWECAREEVVGGNGDAKGAVAPYLQRYILALLRNGEYESAAQLCESHGKGKGGVSWYGLRGRVYALFALKLRQDGKAGAAAFTAKKALAEAEKCLARAAGVHAQSGAKSAMDAAVISAGIFDEFSPQPKVGQIARYGEKRGARVKAEQLAHSAAARLAFICPDSTSAWHDLATTSSQKWGKEGRERGLSAARSALKLRLKWAKRGRKVEAEVDDSHLFAQLAMLEDTRAKRKHFASLAVAQGGEKSVAPSVAAALVLAGEGEWREAEEAVAPALLQSEAFSPPLSVLALLRVEGREEAVDEDLLTAGEGSTVLRDSYTIMKAGVKYWRDGSTQRAAELFRECCYRGEGDPLPHLYLAHTLSESSQPKQAARHYQLCMKYALSSSTLAEARSAVLAEGCAGYALSLCRCGKVREGWAVLEKVKGESFALMLARACCTAADKNRSEEEVERAFQAAQRAMGGGEEAERRKVVVQRRWEAARIWRAQTSNIEEVVRKQASWHLHSAAAISRVLQAEDDLAGIGEAVEGVSEDDLACVAATLKAMKAKKERVLAFEEEARLRYPSSPSFQFEQSASAASHPYRTLAYLHPDRIEGWAGMVVAEVERARKVVPPALSLPPLHLQVGSEGREKVERLAETIARLRTARPTSASVSCVASAAQSLLAMMRCEVGEGKARTEGGRGGEAESAYAQRMQAWHSIEHGNAEEGMRQLGAVLKLAKGSSDTRLLSTLTDDLLFFLRRYVTDAAARVEGVEVGMAAANSVREKEKESESPLLTSACVRSAVMKAERIRLKGDGASTKEVKAVVKLLSTFAKDTPMQEKVDEIGAQLGWTA
uniref:Uncharacterized protein n=1 Tax=Palpitomonas bilix TaxID=652834 RepID=A0A7S3CYA4_9EUKA